MHGQIKPGCSAFRSKSVGRMSMAERSSVRAEPAAGGIRSFGGHEGFTLLEMLIALTIVAILASGLVPLAELSVKRAREAELRAALREIRTAIDAYKRAWDEGRIEKKATDSGYPPNLEVLATGVRDVKAPKDKIIRFLRRVPYDPVAGDGYAQPAQSWGLRSYASPPDAPAAGEDVFDVYSRSELKGLNGIPYRKW